MPSFIRLLALGLLSACAAEKNELDNAPDSAADGGASAGGSGGAGGKGGAGGTKSTPSAAGGATSSGGKNNGGSSGVAGAGQAGNSAGGGSSGSSSGAGGEPADGSPGGSGGGSGACDAASAQLLPAMQSLVVVDTDACLKIEFNADQLEWVHSVTVQPSAGTYPFSFGWSNCGVESSAEFGANYGNQVLSPIDPSCAVLIQLTGPGQSIELQWWGS